MWLHKDSITCEDAKMEVGIGWHGLIDEVYDFLESFPKIQVVQVKEKWGGLRIYFESYDEAIQDFLNKIEARSLQTCEFCGKPGRSRNLSWIKTMCSECLEAYVDQRKDQQ